MEQLIGIAILIVGVLVSIALHEVGHLVPAKKFGTRVPEYFVGFGPTLWSKKKGETEYGIKAIPLGGYVRIVGMIPPEDQVKPVRGNGRIAQLIADTRAAALEEYEEGDDKRAFYRLPWWKKAIVMFGGPAVNLIIAIVLFTVVLTTVGLPQQTLKVHDTTQCVPLTSSECVDTDPVSPAVQAGLQAGDRFVSANGVALNEWTDLTEIIGSSANVPVALVVERDGALVDLNLTPYGREVAVIDDDGKPVVGADGEPETRLQGYMGVWSAREIVPQDGLAGLRLTGDYLSQTAGVIVNLPSHLYDVTRALFGLEERRQDSVMGLVGIGRVAGDVAAADSEGYGLKEKTADMLMLLGGLNLALFAFNMIPLAPLDGGHIASAFWQGIKNGWARLRRLPAPRPVDVARQMPLAYGVFALLLAMGVILIVADIVVPIQLT